MEDTLTAPEITAEQPQQAQQPPDKLQDFYNSLKSNANVKGLPSDYNTFKSAMQDPAKSQAFHSALLSNENITGLPKDYGQFATVLGLKKAGGAGSPLTSSQSPNGLGTIPTFQAPTERPNVNPLTPVTDPALKAHLQQPEIQKQQQLNSAVNAYADAQGGNLPISERQPDAIKAYKAPSPLQRVEGVMGSLNKGVEESVAAPLSYAMNKAGVLSDEDYKKSLDAVANNTDATFGMHPNYLKEGMGGVQTAVNGFANMAPALIAAPSSGGASFGLQQLGNAAVAVNKMKENGVEFNNHSDDLFILGSGLIGTALGRGTMGSVFNSLGSDVKSNIVSGLTADAIKDLGEKGSQATAQDITDAFMAKANTLEEKVGQVGLKAITQYAKVGTELSAANAATFGTKKLANAVSGNEPFKDTTGQDLVQGMAEPFGLDKDAQGNPLTALGNIATSQAGMFGAIGGASEALGVIGNHKAPIIESLQNDNSPDNISAVKSQLAQTGQSKGWTDQEITDASKGVDLLASTVGKLPKNLPLEKMQKGVSIILGQDALKESLTKLQEERAQLHPSVAEIASPQEQLIQDKIDQADDKLRGLVTGQRATYSKGTEADGTEGEFFKTVGGVKEPITPQRYELEAMERDVKAGKVEQPNKDESTRTEPATENSVPETSQEVPAKKVTEEPQVDIKGQQAETDAKIAEFQKNFPDHKVDILEDLPDHVVRTFDRVDADLPTDPVAINEASDWLYNKYKQLTKMKESDTRMLTVTQIEAMQEQLGQDITTLEDHKLKYHGEEAKAEPETQADTGAVSSADKAEIRQEIVNKEGENTDAIQEPGTKGIPLQPTSGDSGEIPVGNTEGGKITKEVAPTGVSSENAQPEEKPINLFKLGEQDEFYHASPTKRVGQLREGEAPQFGKGTYFSTNKDLVINEFGKELTKVNLSIEKPLYTDSADETKVRDLAAKNWNKENLTYDPENEWYVNKNGKETMPVDGNELGERLPVKYYSEAAKELGYDAIIDKNSHTYDNEIVVLDPKKIHYKDEFPQDTGSAVTQGAEPKVADKAKTLADKIRALKSDRSQLHGGLEGIAVATWDGALETIATVIEKGGELADAINEGVKHIMNAHPELKEEDVRKKLDGDINGVVEEPTQEGGSEVKKTILTKRAYEGDIQPDVKKYLEEKGLTRQSFTQEERSKQATDFINKFGEEAAHMAVENGDIEGGMAASILAQLQIRNIREMSNLPEGSDERDALAKKQADIIALMEKKGYLGGEFNGQLAHEYQNAELDYANVKSQVEKLTGKPLTEGQEKKVKTLTSENETLKTKLQEAESKLMEETDKAFKAGEQAAKDETKAQKAKRIADNLRKNAKLSRPGVFSSATPASLVWDGAIEVAAKSIEAGGKVADAIDAGIKHIQESDWYKSLPQNKKALAEKEFKRFNNDKSGSTDLADLQERFVDKEGNKFTTEEARDIWNYMKQTYIENGTSYRDALSKTSEDLGLSWRQVSEAITTPKLKRVSDEMWKRQSDLARNRVGIKNWIGDQNKSALGKALQKVSGLFRGVAVFGHGGIFVGTHAGMTAFNPSMWNKTIPAFFRGWKFAYGNEGNYQRSLEELKNSPNYLIAQRAGLKNNPARINTEEYQKSQHFLGKLGLAGERGFNAIKVLRQDLFDYHFNKLTPAERDDPNVAKSVANLVNLATGATNVKIPAWVNEASFAGGMEAARWEKLTASPVKATQTALNTIFAPSKASAADRVFAKVWARRVGEQLATYSALLLANSAIQNNANPKNPVNFTNPKKPDFMKFKFGNVTIDPTSGMRGAALFMRTIGSIPFQSKQELHGDNGVKALGKDVGGYARGKLAPLYGTAADFFSGQDFSGNIMPYRHDKPSGYAHKLTWGEYAWNKAPLPVAEAASVAYKSALDHGAHKMTLDNVINGIMSGAISGSTGFRVGEYDANAPENKKKH
jgi:hypothetical protein